MTNARQGNGKLLAEECGNPLGNQRAGEIPAENARNEWRHSRFVVFEVGVEVADAARFGEEARKNRIRYSELQEAVEFLNAKQSKLWSQMEQSLRPRVLETTGVGREAVSGAQSSECEAGFAAGRRQRCPESSGPIKGPRLGTKVNEQCWSFAVKEERGRSQQIRRNMSRTIWTWTGSRTRRS